MTSAQANDDAGSTIWADVIHADFETVICISSSTKH